jgi:DNA repair exonuclease SbcCD ATPase subunit
MIVIKNLTCKNFQSVGNVTQCVDFNNSQLNLVLGENLDLGGSDAGSRNGVGKTTILNALSYVLYGSAIANIKKDNLINRTNTRGMIVTVDFAVAGVDYRIERGRKPNLLKFYVNNQEQSSTDDNSQGDSRETQGHIERTLGMSADMFRHIVALNTYSEPFLNLKSGEQRQLIEQLLGITQLSERAERLKESIKVIKDEITSEEYRLKGILTANTRIQEQISGIERRQTVWLKKQSDDIATTAAAIAELQAVDIAAEIAQHALLKDYNEQFARFTSLSKQRATLERSLAQTERTLAKYQREVEQLTNRTCPACEQALHDHKHETMTAAAVAHYEESYDEFNRTTAELNQVLDEIGTIRMAEQRPATYYPTVEAALTHQNNLTTLEQQLLTRADEVDPYQEQIDEMRRASLEEIDYSTINSLNRVREHQEFLHKLLTSKDSFIRKRIIDQNLAYLNARLDHYTKTIGLPHSVVFQNDLSVEITELGRELDFHNLSRGEMNRLIISLSLSFRDVWESLYQPVNLLFIDELIDTGMDAIGVENSMAILKKINRERRKTIFLISHRDELSSRVTNVLRVVKENGYTSFSMSEE